MTFQQIADEEYLSTFAVSVLISKEAFYDAYSNTAVPFVGIFRFNNMDKVKRKTNTINRRDAKCIVFFYSCFIFFCSQDEINSSVLHNQVIAIDMGTTITNLSDRIILNFRNVTEVGHEGCFKKKKFLNLFFLNVLFLGRDTLLSFMEW